LSQLQTFAANVSVCTIITKVTVVSSDNALYCFDACVLITSAIFLLEIIDSFIHFHHYDLFIVRVANFLISSYTVLVFVLVLYLYSTYTGLLAR